jgi:hypothetical protein
LAVLSSALKAFMAQTRPPSILLFAPATGSASKSTTRADFLGTDVYAISVEMPAVFNLDEDLQSGGDIVPADYTQICVTSAVRLNLFAGARVSLWVSFGGGFGHFRESNKVNYFGTNPGGSATTGVIQAGLGL